MHFKVSDTDFSEYDFGIGTTDSGRRHAVSLLLPRTLCRHLCAQNELLEQEKANADALEREQQAQLRKLPSTLRSRFREFTIMPPQGAQAIAVSLSVLKKVLLATAPAGFEPAARSIAVELAHLNPREIYQLTERAVAYALSNHRNALQISDHHADAQLYQIDGANPSRKAGGDHWLH